MHKEQNNQQNIRHKNHLHIKKAKLKRKQRAAYYLIKLMAFIITVWLFWLSVKCGRITQHNKEVHNDCKQLRNFSENLQQLLSSVFSH